MAIIGGVVGIGLIIISQYAATKFFSMNEWRCPLLELSAVLERHRTDDDQRGVRRRFAFIVLFHCLMFVVGALLLFWSGLIPSDSIILIIGIGILSFQLMKFVYGTIGAIFSKRVRLKIFLYSPHLFAWRRDSLGEYADSEIAAAIGKVCDVDISTVPISDLRSFLIGLHQKARRDMPQDRYPELVDENIRTAEEMRRT